MKNYKKRILVTLFASIGIFAMSQSSTAQTSTSIFQANTNLNGSCSYSIGNVNFGVITPSITKYNNPIITTKCSKTMTYNLAISAGNSGSIADRSMKGNTAGNTDVLAYNVYIGGTYTVPWGETVGTNTVALTGNGGFQTTTVYGRLLSNQYVKPDSYSDSLILTLTY